MNRENGSNSTKTNVFVSFEKQAIYLTPFKAKVIKSSLLKAEGELKGGSRHVQENNLGSLNSRLLSPRAQNMASGTRSTVLLFRNRAAEN